MAPNEEQALAISGMIEYFKHPSLPKAGLLIGSAGTGKTFCMESVHNALSETMRLAFTAPTNKATKVLRERLGGRGECRTIYSLLGLQLLPSGEVRELQQRSGVLPIEDIDAAIVDEGSMVNQQLSGLILQASRVHGVPFIFLGDRAQLPPVGEPFSPIFGLEGEARWELTKCMRFDNSILRLATFLRGYVDFPVGQIPFLNDNDGEEGVWRQSRQTFLATIAKAAPTGGFQTGEMKAIAWRNVTVALLNAVIREAIGTQDLSLPFSENDRILAKAPLIDGDKETLMHTGDEATVLKVTVSKHPFYPQFQCYVVKVRTDEDQTIESWVLHPNSKESYSAEVVSLAEAARANKSQWKKFWALKEAFHDITLAYAITAHGSQGSTYRDAFVDVGDILCNQDRAEAAKCLYVACSRPSKRLFIGG